MTGGRDNPGEPAGNPCINLCRMDHTDKFCKGCWRTLLEISRWDQMSDQQKATSRHYSNAAASEKV